MKTLEGIYTKCFLIYDECGGVNDYNDTMIYQLRGLSADLEEYRECKEELSSERERDVLYKDTLAQADATLLWFEWVKKSVLLKSQEPNAIFG